ncbi:unnamed protein product [Meloidogyne enterolobii]|uniref:Uncharacterized protein n=1 Tax=Meloidogyne enterolobii TaxID=390850 RepID=A0ACB0Y2W9_MELEN
MSTKLFKLIQLFLFFVFIIKIVNCGCCCSTEDEDANIVHQPQHNVVPDEIDQLHEEYGGWDDNEEWGNNEWQHNIEEQDDEDEQIPQVENFEDPEEEDNEEDNHFNFPALLANDIPDFDQGDDTTTTSLSTGPPRTSSDSN